MPFLPAKPGSKPNPFGGKGAPFGRPKPSPMPAGKTCPKCGKPMAKCKC